MFEAIAPNRGEWKWNNRSVKWRGGRSTMDGSPPIVAET
jgi:hypothetical protein